MKQRTIFKSFILSTLFCTVSILSYSQVTIPTNVRAGGAFSGWDNSGNPGSLEIRNDFTVPTNQPIESYTGLLLRTIIAGNGNVGIGPGFSVPASMLHLNDGIFGTFQQFTNFVTGALITDGFRMGLIGQTFVFNQQEAFPMRFQVNGALRQIILANGNVGIGTNFLNPLFRLDVEEDINITIGPNVLNQSYRINGQTVLQIPGQENTFVGQFAGIALTTGFSKPWLVTTQVSVSPEDGEAEIQWLAEVQAEE